MRFWVFLALLFCDIKFRRCTPCAKIGKRTVRCVDAWRVLFLCAKRISIQLRISAMLSDERETNGPENFEWVRKTCSRFWYFLSVQTRFWFIYRARSNVCALLSRFDSRWARHFSRRKPWISSFENGQNRRALHELKAMNCVLQTSKYDFLFVVYSCRSQLSTRLWKLLRS